MGGLDRWEKVESAGTRDRHWRMKQREEERKEEEQKQEECVFHQVHLVLHSTADILREIHTGCLAHHGVTMGQPLPTY